MHNYYEWEELARLEKEDLEKWSREAWKLEPAEKPAGRFRRLFLRRHTVKGECGYVVRPE